MAFKVFLLEFLQSDQQGVPIRSFGCWNLPKLREHGQAGTSVMGVYVSPSLPGCEQQD